MSAETQKVMSPEDFRKWELKAINVLADLKERYMGYTVKIVPVQPGAGRVEQVAAPTATQEPRAGT